MDIHDASLNGRLGSKLSTADRDMSDVIIFGLNILLAWRSRAVIRNAGAAMTVTSRARVFQVRQVFLNGHKRVIVGGFACA